MRSVLILILTLSPLIGLSQRANIDLNDEIVILDKKKAIEVAKIIENEERLFQYAKELEEMVLKLNDSIQKFEQKSLNRINRLILLEGNVTEKQNEINRLTERQYEIQKKLNNFGLYGFTSFGGNPQGFNSLDLGLQLVGRRKLFSISVDPFLFEKPSYKIGFGLKIF